MCVLHLYIDLRFYKSESSCDTIHSVLLLVGEQVDRALHLSLAALLGNDIYNFGELVGHH